MAFFSWTCLTPEWLRQMLPLLPSRRWQQLAWEQLVWPGTHTPQIRGSCLPQLHKSWHITFMFHKYILYFFFLFLFFCMWHMCGCGAGLFWLHCVHFLGKKDLADQRTLGSPSVFPFPFIHHCSSPPCQKCRKILPWRKWRMKV